MDKKQKKWLILSIAISVTVLFAVLFFTVDINTLTELKNCNIWFILLAILMHIISICFWANRIQIMSWSLGYKVPFLHTVNLVCSNQFVASVTPSQVGGEPVRIYELTKANVPVADATAIVLMERVFDAIVLAVGALAGAVMLNIFFSSIDVPQIYLSLSYIAVAVFLAVVVLFIFMAKIPSFGRKVILGGAGFFLKKKSAEKRTEILSSLSEQVDRFYAALNHFLGRSKTGFFLGLFFSALFWVNEFLLVSVLMMGLGLEPNFVLTFIFMILITVILMIPITPGGAGVAEISMGGFFSLIVPKSMVGILVLLWRLIIYYFNLLTGFIATLIILRREAKDENVKQKEYHDNNRTA